jgi:hypothetical protein
MRNLLFVVSHMASGVDHLVSILNQNPRIDIKNLKLTYNHPTVLDHLFSRGHKLDNAAAIYGDQILYNKDLSCKAFYAFSKFIYVVRSPKSSLNEIIGKENFTPKSALRHYQFRLRRIYEMYRHTPKSIYLTWDDLQKPESLSCIDSYLSLKTPLQWEAFPESEPDNFDLSILNEAQDSYEQHLFRINQVKSQSE